MPGRREVDFQALGGFIILQCFQFAWYFPSLCQSLRVSELGGDRVNPGMRGMLRGLHPIFPGRVDPWDQTRTLFSPSSHPTPSAPQLWAAPVSVSCHLICYAETAFVRSFVPPP